VVSMEPSVDDPGPTFGYFPDPDQVEEVLDRAEFMRAVVLDATIRVLADRVKECRIVRSPEYSLSEGALLPEGIYWFEGIERGSLILQVGIGGPPGPATIVPVDSLGDGHQLGEVLQWAEWCWERGAPVPAPLFAVNEPAMTHPGGHDVVVRDRKFVGHQWIYSVISDGRRQDIVESQLRPSPQLDHPSVWVTGEPMPAGRFSATLTRAKLLGRFANTLFSFRATRTTFRPYQFKPVLKLLQTGKSRILIADEVGLGKTIEAGLIWTELEARQEADRVLVVCPSNLVAKWKEEMVERFGFELAELDSPGLKTFLERYRQNRLPKRQAYIASLERLRTWDGLDEIREFPPEFDLVIVDEAHAMRNQDTKSYALGALLAEWADNVVFLTATPINLREEDLLNLLELLAPEDFGDIHDLEFRLAPNRVINAVASRLAVKGVKGRILVAQLEELRKFPLGRAIVRRPEFVLLRDLLMKDDLTPRDVVDAKRYLAELNTLSTVITRTRKVEVDDRKAKRVEDRREVRWTAAEENFYREYVQWCRYRAEAMDSTLYFAMQMPLRLASACLPMARRAVLEPEAFGLITDSDSDAPAARIDPHPELVAAAMQLPEHVDTKFDSLREVLRELHRQGKRALLFTHSRPTLRYLRERLANDFDVAVLHGGVPREERQRIMAGFRAGRYNFVLANRVASEGLDFEFCSAVINYDLPWNPMEVEQRIGRIDRIGQVEEAILVVNFVNESTIDERILVRLLDRIRIFESSIGPLEPIIAEHAPRALQAGFDFTLTEQQREQKLHEVLTAIEEQRANLKDLVDASSALLVSNDVAVVGLADDLVRTGRYFGQRELALLLDDWAQVDGAPPPRIAADGLTMELRGNAAMAARVNELAASAQRTRAEVRELSSQLRDEMPITLVLDQEHARTFGGTLLTATSPLVMAAATVPSHRQARFASLQVAARPDVVAPGTYVVVLARAIAASRGGDEIWGAAVTALGHPAGDGPVDALLAALAEGRLEDAPLPTIERLPRFVERAMDQLSLRHTDEQARRLSEFEALQAARSATLAEQYQRKVKAIERRIETALARNRGSRAIALFRSQLGRAAERHARLSEELMRATQPEIRLEPLAACVVTFIAPMEA
jgi:Superfamily II DNA/RNA helicases, SNF2 family